MQPNAHQSAVICLSYFEAKPQYRDDLLQALLSLVEPTQTETGCLQYELVIDNENPNFFIMVEKFINQSALDSHEQQSYIKQFVAEKMSLYCDKVTWHVGRVASIKSRS